MRRIDEIAATAQDIEPWLRQSDSLTIYFTSSRIANTTIWTATRASPSDPFANPTRLDELASSDYDGSPWVDAAQQYMVFHTSRDGTYDLYETSRDQPTGTWSAPRPVAIVNTPESNESDAWISPDGHTLIYTSHRAGTDDLYMSTR